jgi:hypothetical protein
VRPFSIKGATAYEDDILAHSPDLLAREESTRSIQRFQDIRQGNGCQKIMVISCVVHSRFASLL